ncbi:MAG: hypothetical protein QXP55_02155 [Nitrososphaerales archaeon]
MSNIRKEFLELLRTDEEFRYAVAGLLGLEEILKKLDMHGAILAKYGEELMKLREDMNKGFARHDEELMKLREDMIHGFELIEKRLSSIEHYIERTSLTFEEEAFEVISGKLERIGIKIALKRLTLPDLEINVYGETNEICIIGEVTTRAGIRIVVKMDEKAKELMNKHPELIRPKMIKILYTMWITEEAIEEAKKRGVWVLKTTKELTPLILSDI